METRPTDERNETEPCGTVIVIAGPTASGKSGLAASLAEHWNGVVINADSMQVYRELAIVTARPSSQAMAQLPHRLYGHISATDAYSVDQWRRQAVMAISNAWEHGQLPIVVGGTGLYMRALLDGLAPIPVIPDQVRSATRRKFDRLGNQAFHAALSELDPAMAARLEPGDSQRMVRAYEVASATGRSLAEWQAEPATGGLDACSLKVLLMPPRNAIYEACDNRFDRMVEAGALAEVASFVALGVGEDRPAAKALGIPALRAHLAGELDLETAIEWAKRETRRYAKRQSTWFRHQFSADLTLDCASDPTPLLEAVGRFVLTRRNAPTRPSAAEDLRHQ